MERERQRNGGLVNGWVTHPPERRAGLGDRAVVVPACSRAAARTAGQRWASGHPPPARHPTPRSALQRAGVGGEAATLLPATPRRAARVWAVRFLKPYAGARHRVRSSLVIAVICAASRCSGALGVECGEGGRRRTLADEQVIDSDRGLDVLLKERQRKGSAGGSAAPVEGPCKAMQGQGKAAKGQCSGQCSASEGSM